MTLQEKLDGKLPRLSTLVWEELEKVFLGVENELLPAGVTVSVFKNAASPRFCYLLESSNSKAGTNFTYNFDVKVLEEVIKFAKENGLKVELIEEKGLFYKFIYSPPWLR